MAIFYFQSGKSYANVNQIRATILAPIYATGVGAPTYSLPNSYTTVPGVSGLEVTLSGRYEQAGKNIWETHSATGNM